MITPTLMALAQAARPINEDDYASDRQINAENRFFEECVKVDPVAFSEESDFASYCLKATTDEAVDEAIRILSASPQVIDCQVSGDPHEGMADPADGYGM